MYIVKPSVVAMWVENPYWQNFCGELRFQHKPPIDPTTMNQWRKKIKAIANDDFFTDKWTDVKYQEVLKLKLWDGQNWKHPLRHANNFITPIPIFSRKIIR